MRGIKLWHHRLLAWSLGWSAGLLFRIILVWYIKPWSPDGTLTVNAYEYAGINSLPWLVHGVVFCWVAWGESSPGVPKKPRISYVTNDTPRG